MKYEIVKKLLNKKEWLFYVFSNGFNRLVFFIATFWFVTKLGAEQFGMLSVALAFFITGQSSFLSIQSLVAVKLHNSKLPVQIVNSVGVKFFTLFAVGNLLLLCVVAALDYQSGRSHLLFLVYPNLLLSNIVSLVIAYLYSSGSIKAVAYVLFASSIWFLLLILVIQNISIYLVIAFYYLYTLFQIFWLRRKIPSIFQGYRINGWKLQAVRKYVTKYYVPLLLSMVAVPVIIWLVNFWISRKMGYKEAGFVVLMLQVQNMINFLPQVVNTLFFRELVSTGVGAALHTRMKNNLLVIISMAGFPSILLILLAETILLRLDNSYVAFVTEFRLFIVAFFFATLGNVAGNFLNARLDFWKGTYINLRWAIVFVSLFFIFMSIFNNLLAVSLCFLLSYVLHIIFIVFSLQNNRKAFGLSQKI